MQGPSAAHALTDPKILGGRRLGVGWRARDFPTLKGSGHPEGECPHKEKPAPEKPLERVRLA